VRIEYRRPQMPLPSLSLAHRINVRSPGSAPFPDHAPPGNRILAKQPRQLCGKQDRSELDVGISFRSRLDVVAGRPQVGVVAMARTSKALEQDQLELLGVQDLQVLVRRLEKFGQIIPQKRKFQSLRAANLFVKPIADELFDDAVGYDNRDRLE